ncbi:MAG: hypothetical protein M3N93_01680 [Acidobacteriota bacterium]|nr:hypothetical protein [Acidobacteriota bacterium]
MHRLLLLTLVFVLTLNAANLRLYLKDGSFQMVREYRAENDRVNYYSVERSDWEEIPLDLVDMKRTVAETAARQETIEKTSKAISEEEEAAKEARREIQHIPQDPGVYQLDDKLQLRIFKPAEVTVHNARGRNVLRALSPVPLISGKANLETAGGHSLNVVKDASPEFFIQLSVFESFAIIRLTPEKGVRIVEGITVMPVTKENMEERQLVPTFTKQLSDNGLYKIWPQDRMPPGEYAVVEYTEGKMNMQVWDFRIE